MIDVIEQIIRSMEVKSIKVVKVPQMLREIAAYLEAQTTFSGCPCDLHQGERRGLMRAVEVLREKADNWRK